MKINPTVNRDPNPSRPIAPVSMQVLGVLVRVGTANVPQIAENIWSGSESREGRSPAIGGGRGRFGAVSRALSDLFRRGLVSQVAGWYTITERGIAVVNAADEART